MDTEGVALMALLGNISVSAHLWALIGIDCVHFNFLLFFAYFCSIEHRGALPGGPVLASEGGCADKQSAQIPPVRRAADRHSSTRVCQTRVRKSRSTTLPVYIVISRNWTGLITW